MIVRSNAGKAHVEHNETNQTGLNHSLSAFECLKTRLTPEQCKSCSQVPLVVWGERGLEEIVTRVCLYGSFFTAFQAQSRAFPKIV
jgi:hypothetical protein